MKKYLLFTIIFSLLISCKTFDDSAAIHSDYSEGLENIKHNVNNNRMDLFEGYAQAEKLHRKYESRISESDNSEDRMQLEKIEEYQQKLADQMQIEMIKSQDEKAYEDALRYALSLDAINKVSPVQGMETVTKTMKNIYEQIIAQNDNSGDIFTQNKLKYEMLDRQFLPTEELYNLLHGLAQRKSKGEFLYVLDKYSRLYPDILSRYPQLNAEKNDVLAINELKFDNMLNSIVMVVLDKGMNIKNGMGYMDKSIGTGFFIDNNGYILTNHHVIADHVNPHYKGFSKVTVIMRNDPDTEIPATVVGYDKVFDIALLKIAKNDTPPLVLGHSADMQLGDKVYAIGNPIGIKNTVTSGIISNMDVEFFQLGKAFQIDAAVNPGNSGGPLVDEAGQVIAIVFAGIPSYQGINFAIPFRWVMNSIPKLYQGGEVKRCWIGAGIYNDGGAVRVHWTMPTGTAAMAGIRVGDIIRKIDGENVTSVEEAQEHLSWKRYPMLLDMEIERDGELQHKTVRLVQRPYMPIESIFEEDVQRKIIALAFGVELDYYKKGIMSKKFRVTKVYKGMAGAQAGIVEGESLTVYDVKYMDKEKAIVLVCSFKNAETSTIERVISIPVAAEMNCLL